MILLVRVAGVPLLAWAAASAAESAPGMDFFSAFAAVLLIAGLLGFFALFGIASEAQKSHDQAIDRNPAPQGGGD